MVLFWFVFFVFLCVCFHGFRTSLHVLFFLCLCFFFFKAAVDIMPLFFRPAHAFTSVDRALCWPWEVDCQRSRCPLTLLIVPVILLVVRHVTRNFVAPPLKAESATCLPVYRAAFVAHLLLHQFIH